MIINVENSKLKKINKEQLFNEQQSYLSDITNKSESYSHRKAHKTYL